MLKYRRLFEELRGHITSGKPPPGSRLDSEPKLAQQYGVSRQTIRQAIALLEEEGLVDRVQGSGTYVRQPESPAPRPSTHTIALVLTSDNEYILPPIISGISSTLMEAGYTTSLYVTNNSLENEARILRGLLDNPPDGLLLEPIRNVIYQLNQDLYRQIEQTIPCVLLHSEYPGSNLPCVSPDNEGTAAHAVQYLFQRGHRRIGGIFKLDDLASHARFAGYVHGLHDCGLLLEESKVVWYTTETMNCLYDGSYGNYLYELLCSCTALVCFNDEIASLIYQFARNRGLFIPQDLSLISFDDSILTRMEYSLSSYAHPKAQLGIRAAENLLHLIQDPTFNANCKFLLELTERTSVCSRAK